MAVLDDIGRIMLHKIQNFGTLYTKVFAYIRNSMKECITCKIKKDLNLFRTLRNECNECRNLKRRSKYYPSNCLHCKTDFRPGIRGRYKFCNEVCRFMNKVKKDESGCWLWQAGKHSDGYGDFVPLGGKSGLAHRASFRLFKGPIPEGMWVLHSCHVPSCVNPDHLRLGNNKDNIDDMLKAKKNNQPKGESSGMSKITQKIVLKIREKAKEGLSYAAIGRIFKISAVQVSNIVRKISWKHV